MMTVTDHALWQSGLHIAVQKQFWLSRQRARRVSLNEPAYIRVWYDRCPSSEHGHNVF